MKHLVTFSRLKLYFFTDYIPGTSLIVFFDRFRVYEYIKHYIAHFKEREIAHDVLHVLSE